MMIFKITDGLGNQMFQYALAKRYQMRGRQVFLDTEAFGISEEDRKYGLKLFQLSVGKMPGFFRKLFYSPNFFWRLFRHGGFFWLGTVMERDLAYHAVYTNLPDWRVIAGYFQNEQYFYDIRDQIRKDFIFRYPLSPSSQEYLNEIAAVNSVAVHVRRGDYLTDDRAVSILGTLPIAYYQRALAMMSEKVRDLRVFIFSDDLRWAGKALGTFLPEYKLVEGNVGDNSWQDMLLMSRCKHQVIANSTFSWWSAWLNDDPGKIVVGPAQWFADREMNDRVKIIPAGWLTV